MKNTDGVVSLSCGRKQHTAAAVGGQTPKHPSTNRLWTGEGGGRREGGLELPFSLWLGLWLVPRQ